LELVKVKLKKSRNRPGVAQSVPGGLGSQISIHSAHEGGEVVSLTHRPPLPQGNVPGIARAERDGTRAETRFRLSAKRTSPFKSSGTSVQSTAGSRGVRISGSNAGYIMFRGSAKSTGYPLLAAEVCASAVVMLDTQCSEVV
jgi:hypothetical protein